MPKMKPIRVGVVGLGRAGWGMHCTEIDDRPEKFQIVAACDVIAERRAMAERRYGCQTFQRVEQLAACEEVELVSIATRSCDHLEHARIALRAGKDVLLEKPACTTYPEFQRLRRSAGRAKGRLFVKQNRRFEPAFHHVREILDSGVLGRILEIKLRRLDFKRRNDWQTYKRYGGGILSNWGPHIVDHALQLLGAPVRDLWSDLRRGASGGDAEAHARLLLRGRNGRVVDLEISDTAALGAPVYVVLGDRGALTSDERTIRLRTMDPKRLPEPMISSSRTPGDPETGGFTLHDSVAWIEQEIPVAPSRPVDITSIWDALYDAIRRDKAFPVTLDDVGAILKTIDAARRGTPFERRAARN